MVPASRRLARRVIAITISRSRDSSARAGNGGSHFRCVFRNNCGCSKIRWRMAGVAFRQAAYNWPASRLVNRCAANPSAMR